MIKVNKSIPWHVTVAELKKTIESDPSFVFPVVDLTEGFFLGSLERTDIQNFIQKIEKFGIDPRKRIHLDYDPAVVTVLEDTSLQQLHLFFITLKLRYAFVTHFGITVGVVTREVLSNALKQQVHLI